MLFISRRRWFVLLLTAAAVGGCATVAGLDGYGVVGEGAAVGAPGSDGGPGGPSTSSDTGGAAPDFDSSSLPPPCDPAKDEGCISLPPDFHLVGVTDVIANAITPGCPTGLDATSELGGGPSAKDDSCTCTCAVTQGATCEGPLTHHYGDNPGCGNPDNNGLYKNLAYQSCNSDVYPGTLSPYQRFSLPPASGGSCAPVVGTTTPHLERIDWTTLARVCDNTKRCGGGVCDARVGAPFIACVANAPGGGDVACPTGFPQKRVLGGGATFGCSACSCTIARTPCVGTLTHHKNNGCSGGDSVVSAADGACHPFLGSGTYKTYVVDAGSTTSCGGATAATNVGIVAASTRTICCR